MKTWENKWALGFGIALLAASLTLGAAVWHYGSTYEKSASVYMRNLSWALPHSTDYQYITIDETVGNLYRCVTKDQVEIRDSSGKLVKTEQPAESGSTGEDYQETIDRLGWKSYKGREIHNIYTVDEDTYAVSFKGKTVDQSVTDYMLFDQNMKPILGDQMFEVILKEYDGMRYFISSDTSFDGKPAEKECGFLNSSGQVAFTFDHIPLCVNDFSEGLTIVYDDRLYGYDKEGRQVFALDYEGGETGPSQRETYEEYTTYTPYYTQFSCGLAPVTLDGEKMGYIDKQGELVIPALFAEAGLVLDGTAAVCLIQGDSPSTLVKSRWGILDLGEVQ